MSRRVRSVSPDGKASEAPTPRKVAEPARRSVGAVVDHTWTGQGGVPLGSTLRRRFEPLFGQDFSQVRVHDDTRSHTAAARAGARAFAVGNHLHFRRGEFRPDDDRGARLLAHELTHTIHQHGAISGSPAARGPDRRNARLEHEADAAATAVTSGRAVKVQSGTALAAGGRPIAQYKLDLNDFEGGDFSVATLQSYLGFIRGKLKIQDHLDSDDKAREIVKQWRKGTDDFTLDPTTKVLLIKEMQSGFTGNDDERAILNLLEFSTHADIDAMFSPGALDPNDLDSDFQGDEEDELRGFYDREFTGGRKVALKGGRSLQPEKLTTLTSPYDAAALRSMVAERRARIALTIRDVPVAPDPEHRSDKRNEISQEMARRDAADVNQEIQKLTPDEREHAVKDLLSDRVQLAAKVLPLEDAILGEKDATKQQQLQREQIVIKAELSILDFAIQPAFSDVALAAPRKKADFQKQTTPLDATQKAAARDAIKAVTRPGSTFVETLADEKQIVGGKKITYGQKIAARLPALIQDRHDRVAKGRDEAEHKEEKNVHKLTEIEKIANQSKKEVDRVFGHFYKQKDFKAFKAEVRDKDTLKVKKSGNLHDLWSEEQRHRIDDPSYQEASAKFWLFYMIQNDEAIKKVNYDHGATPKFGEDSVPLDDAAKIIRAVGDPVVSRDSKRLFEIGRGWPAVQSEHEVFVQLFKDPDAKKDRIYLWDMFFTLMHEYLHSLSSDPYSKYAESLGGEHSTEGNTLIEGVDSMLAEIAWVSAQKRASLLEVRNEVEPDVVAAGEPFDKDLLPKMPADRYPTYSQALKLVNIVGIQNLYAAYFQGRVDLIGKK